MPTQSPAQKFESKCKKAFICVDNDMPLGEFHDFLLNTKGHTVDLVVKAQKEDEAAAAQQKALDKQDEAAAAQQKALDKQD